MEWWAGGEMEKPCCLWCVASTARNCLSIEGQEGHTLGIILAFSCAWNDWDSDGRMNGKSGFFVLYPQRMKD
jgi:hypothetical protein